MRPDVIIIGSGMGGATFAATLAPTGRRILILERGESLRANGKDRDANAIFRDGYFHSDEQWIDADGAGFYPGNYSVVGGNSKFYGAALMRFRKEDFIPRAHLGGRSIGWPFAYDDLEPFYAQAEQMYAVRGVSGVCGALADPTDPVDPVDPTEPFRSNAYPFPPVPHEPDIQWLKERLYQQGLSPSTIPLGVDLDAWLSGGETPWDGFPNIGKGKMDAESCALVEALKYPNVELCPSHCVQKLSVGTDGRITAVLVKTPQGNRIIEADQFVLAAGAVQSAALLLRSSNEAWPCGLSNSSDQVGRNFMNHNASAIMALHPSKLNRAVYQKTLMVNDFYHDGPGGEGPLGNIQMLGKISGDILRANVPWLGGLADWIAKRSFDFYAMSEDLPDPESRVSIIDDEIKLNWKRTNWRAHMLLVDAFKQRLKGAGFPFVLSRPFDHRTPSHQCGTARMGVDPASSVVDPLGQSHDHPNLIISDASVLPTSAALNPALTIAALSMRFATALEQRTLRP